MLKYFTNNRKLIHYIICAVLMFGVGLIPPIGTLTSSGMGMLGVFLGTVYGWTVIGMLWPSMLAMVAMSLIYGMQAVLAVSFGNSTIMMMLMMLILMEFLNATHVTELLATFFLTNKMTRGRPWTLIFLFFIGAYVCSIINPIVTIMMFMGFTMQICETTHIELKSPFTAIMALGIALAALLGQSTLPFYNAGISYTATYASMFQTQIPYDKWIIYFFIVSMVFIVLYTIVSRFVFRMDVSKLAAIDTTMFGERKALSGEQKIAIASFVAFLIIVIVSSFLPASNPIGAFLTGITPFGQVILIIAVLMVLVKPSKEELFNFRELAAKGVSWDVVFMVSVIMALAQYLTGEDTGVTQMIALLLQPLMGMPPMAFIFMALLLGILVTNFTNNFVVALVIMPVLYSFASQVGINPMGSILTLFVCTQIALGTPGASFPVGICYSFSNIVNTSMMMKYAWLTVLLLAILSLCVALPLAIFLF